MEEKGEAKNRVQRHNIFEHYKEDFQPHTLTLLPSMIQAFKEYRERSNLDPNLGNLWGCFWESCNIKERGFWQAALEHHANYSLTDDSRVYHAITFGEDYPDYKPANDEMPSDKPEDNDQRFCYYTEVRRWNECQVKEERTLRVASDKVQSWLDIGDTILDSTAVFPPSQEEANQATAASKKAAKGAKKRPSSVPPGSDTAKAKQAKAQADAKEKKPVAEKVKVPTIPKQELAAIATTLTNKVRTVVPTLNPKHYRTIHNLASEWYRALYHTKFQMTKSDYLNRLHKTAEGYQRAKESNPAHLGVFNKALNLLKYSVNAPTTAGLRDPSYLQAELLAAQQQAKPKRDKSAPGTYAAAVTGSTDTPTLPIGARRPSATPAVKVTLLSLPLEHLRWQLQRQRLQQGMSLLELVQLSNKALPSNRDDGALEFLANAPPDHSFADYQAAQGAKPARDTQSGQSTPASRACRDTRDKRAAQDAQSASSQSKPASQAPGASDRALNEEDEIAMQQALWQSRQQAQMQDVDPTVSSSAGGTAIQPKSIEEEVEEELEKGQGFQEEASSLEKTHVSTMSNFH